MEQFLSTYNVLNRDNLHLLEEIYTTDIRFIDPAHEIIGLEKLTAYFTALYANVESIDFLFHDQVTAGDNGYVQWDMTFRHSRLSGGRSITVPGTTYVRYHPDGKVFYHRDYFDLGAMLYENLPLIGGLVTGVKRRLGK